MWDPAAVLDPALNRCFLCGIQTQTSHLYWLLPWSIPGMGQRADVPSAAPSCLVAPKTLAQNRAPIEHPTPGTGRVLSSLANRG